ncbi:lymphocyte function-associated antigen 3 isoform X2 [Oryx dammah]|uniref:lymphocyte function-associated antigen 3 isoform X2 n=1 Tax=Oryx dammah TaxID=59534 RepID=UPI001A9B17C1|nr:lymphocyte function-associated antigen 3 isoform X2 [Oryx dammah]
MAAGSAPGCALGALGLVCLFLKLDFISCFSQDIYGAMDGSVTFYVSESQPFTEIIWKKGKDKVAEWDQKSGLEVFQSFINRVHLDIVSGNLTITGLTKSDEDVYVIESPNVKKSSEFHLRVIAPPPTPSASCFLTDGGNITLTCSIQEDDTTVVDDADLIRYLWECPPTIQCHHGSILSEAYVSAESDLSQNVQCIVSNPLFRTSAPVSLSSCLPEALPLTPRQDAVTWRD